jgi:hypothetical protein
MYQQPGIILLREGTDQSQGKAQLISNINACQAVQDTVRTTLGPRGMDKLMSDGRKVTISNDGATIMKQLDIAHPAAKTLVDISMSQVSLRSSRSSRAVMIIACARACDGAPCPGQRLALQLQRDSRRPIRSPASSSLPRAVARVLFIMTPARANQTGR